MGDYKAQWVVLAEALEDAHDVLLGKATQPRHCKARTGWYNYVFKICNAPGGSGFIDFAYQSLVTWAGRRLDVAVAPILSACRDAGVDADADSADVDGSMSAEAEELVFREVTRHFGAWRALRSFAAAALNYVDAQVQKRGLKRSISEIFFTRFHDLVYAKVRVPLLRVILRRIATARNGSVIDMRTLQDAVSVFVEVATSVERDDVAKQQKYDADFARFYLDAMADHYSEAAACTFSADGGPFEFMLWAERSITFEEQLNAKVARRTPRGEVLARLDRAMLAPMARDMIAHPNAGFAALLTEMRPESLGRMHRLLRHITVSAVGEEGAEPTTGAHLMGQELQLRITHDADALVSQFVDSVSEGALSLERPLVEGIMALSSRHIDLSCDQYARDPVMYAHLRRGFATSINRRLTRTDPKPGGGDATEKKPTSFSEVLATYCDAVMKRDLKDVVDPDAELERLDQLLQVFTYLEEKDVFQDFYKAKLARRLLQTTPNEDLEKAFLERLQREMGKAFTHKMEGMLLDRESTKQHAERFNKDAMSAGLPATFDVQVLTEANWPSYKSDTLVQPMSLKRCAEAFTRFYKRSNATRKLTWINMLGSSLLHVTFNRGAKDVSMSIYQAAVLLAVDQQRMISVAEIAEAIGFEVKAVKPHLASMYLNKQFSMIALVDKDGAKQPPNKSIQDTDRFVVNDGFMHKMRKFKVPTAMMASGAGSGMPTESEIDSRRKIQVDAAVVRIMKSRRTMNFTELQDEVIRQLTKYFIPQPKLIKLRVEDLVTRDYLRRHDDDPKMFDYLA
jgi:hypothetical protein